MSHRSTLAPYTYTPAKLGLDAVTLASARTSNSFDVRYRSEASVSVKYGGGGAASNCLVKFQHSPNNGTDWFDLQEVTVASGADTLEDFEPTKTSNDADNFEVRVKDLNFKDMRITISGASGDASDIVSAWVTVK